MLMKFTHFQLLGVQFFKLIVCGVDMEMVSYTIKGLCKASNLQNW